MCKGQGADKDFSGQRPILSLDLGTTIKGLKAITREAREATAALTALKEAKEAHNGEDAGEGEGKDDVERTNQGFGSRRNGTHTGAAGSR